MKKKTTVKNPIARVVRTMRPAVVANRKGKGSYNRNKEKANSDLQT